MADALAVVASGAGCLVNDPAGGRGRAAVRNKVVTHVEVIDQRSGCYRRRCGGRSVGASTRHVAADDDAQTVRQRAIIGEVAQIGLLAQAVSRVVQASREALDLCDVAIEGVLVAAITVINQGALIVRSWKGAAPRRCDGGRVVARRRCGTSER